MFPRALFTANPYSRGTRIYASAPSGLLDLLPADGRVAFWYAGDGTGAGDYVTTAGDGQPVDAILDQVGSDDLANTGAARPTYDADGLGGRGALVFDGTQNLNKAVALGTQSMGGTAYAIYAVATLSAFSVTPSAVYGEGRASSGGSLTAFFGFSDASPDRFYALQWFASSKGLPAGTPEFNTPYLIVLYRAADTLYLRVNGADVGSRAQTETTNQLNTLAIGACAMVSIQRQLVGRVGLVARYADHADLASAEAVIASHYGITLP